LNTGTITEYFENLCSYKLENLEEMDKFLDIYDLLKLTPEDTNKLNKSIMNNEIEILTTTNHNRKAQDQMDSLLNSTRLLKNYTNAPQTIPQNIKGRSASKFIP
jgi:nitrate reductase cytochrome c-type subunit